jgi:lysophospholipase L1-like esterase
MSRCSPRNLLASLALLLFAGGLATAVSPDKAKPDSYEKQVQGFEAADRESPPPKGGILFVGSSSIRRWTTLATDFPDRPVINRGIGGSHIHHAVHNAPRIVRPYQPRAVVLYAGGNDLNDGDTSEEVFGDFKNFVQVVRASQPKVPIFFISIAPNPSRWSQVEQVKKANTLIRAYTKRERGLIFVDVFPRMLGPDGKPMGDIFVADGLHMNEKGYAIWTKVLRPLLPR